MVNASVTKVVLEENPNGQCLYVMCMSDDGKIVVKQEYTVDEAGKCVPGERTILDHDPEDEFLDHGYLAERALSMPDEVFAEVSEDMLVESFPKEWLEYLHRERQNHDDDDWYSLVPDPESPVTEPGGAQ